MRRLLAALAVAGALMAGPLVVSVSANPAIHEIVAAYCSGGGKGTFNGWELEPPGITDPTKSNFARPVIASGAAAVVGGQVVITDKPNAKFAPGTVVIDFATGASDLGAATANHPSAAHCPGASSLP